MTRFTISLAILATPLGSQEHVLPAPAYSSGELVGGMDAGFLDTDRNVDVVLFSGDELGVMLGTHAQDFTPASFSDPLDGTNDISAVHLADLDGDGLTDVLVSASDTLALLLGNGDGSFDLGWEETVSFDPSGREPTSLTDVAAGDLDGDGLLDIIGTSDAWKGIGWRGATQPATFQGGEALPGEPTGMQCFDMDGDGFNDVVVSHVDPDGVTVVWGPFDRGTGGAASQTTLATQATPGGVRVGFIDTDAYPDIVVANEGSDSVTLHAGSASGFQRPVHIASGRAPREVRLQDVDGDGLQDVVAVGRDGLLVHRHDPAAGLQAPDEVQLSHLSGDLHFFDVDGDGLPDPLFLAGETGPGYLLSDGQGNLLGMPDTIRVGAGWRELVPLDLNADGQVDLISIVSAGGDGARVLVGDGQGDFNPLLPIPLSSAPTQLAAGDVDADGDPDVLLTSSLAGTFSVLGSDGSGGFAAPVNLQVQSEPDGIALADLDRDGILDVGLATRQGLIVLLGKGGGGFQAGINVSSGHYRKLVSADFNLDGATDLAVSREVNASVVALANIGDGISYLEQRHSIPTPAIGLTAADADADGATDLLVLHTPGAKTTLRRLWNDGSGMFSSSDILRVPYDAAGQILVGDLNADGLPDLAVPSDAPSAVAVHHGLGGRDLLDPILHGGLGARDELEDLERNERIALADFDSDGRLDLAFEEGSPQADLCLMLNRVEDAPRTASFGTGTGGCLGTMTLATDGAPDLGNDAFAITGANAPPTAAGALALSLRGDIAGRLLPGLGLTLHVDVRPGNLFFIRIRSDRSGALYAPLKIPPSAALDGLTLYAQAFFRWPLSGPCLNTPSGVSSSQGIVFTLGEGHSYNSSGPLPTPSSSD